MTRTRLTSAAAGFRLFHTAVAVVELAAVAEVWAGALRRRRGRVLWSAVTALSVEAVALVIGRGDCPLGPLQRRLGDPVPLFELVLPARAAKAAVPLLAATSITGIVLLALRPPRTPGPPESGSLRAGRRLRGTVGPSRSSRIGGTRRDVRHRPELRLRSPRCD